MQGALLRGVSRVLRSGEAPAARLGSEWGAPGAAGLSWCGSTVQSVFTTVINEVISVSKSSSAIRHTLALGALVWFRVGYSVSAEAAPSPLVLPPGRGSPRGRQAFVVGQP